MSRGQILARLVLTAVVVWAAWQAPTAIRAAHDDVERQAPLTRDERELAAARSVDLSTEFLLAAERTLPEDAVYLVAVGENVPVSHTASLDAAAPYLAYWLLPRRRTDDLAKAEWVLSYGGDPGALGFRYRRTVDVSQGLAILEVER